MERPLLQQVHRTYVRFGARKLSYFSGCDYFRLASHPEVIEALKAAVDRYGLNVAASRATTGDHALYHQLEQALARFFDAETALLVPSGYSANLVVAQGLAGAFTRVALEERAHPSLCDAANLFSCPVYQFRHRDPAGVKRLLSRFSPSEKWILLTDGLFAHDGSAAPLPAYIDALPRNAWLLVDDAHGAGVLGRNGQGTLEHHGVSRRRVIQTITLSKALGTYGGAILVERAVRARVARRSRAFVGSTPMPLPLAGAALESLGILRRDPSLRVRLRANTRWLKDGLKVADTRFADTPGPILAIKPADTSASSKLTAALLAAKIFPPFINYPGGPTGGYFRFAISSEHTEAQLSGLLRVLVSSLEKQAP